MQLVHFNDAAECARRVEPFLVRQEAENNLPLGLIASAKEFSGTPYLACIEDQGEVAAVAVRTPPRGLVLSVVQKTAALEVIAQDVFDRYGDLPDVTGPNPAPAIFADCWKSISGMTSWLDDEMRVYRLERVRPVTGVGGENRRVTDQERDLLVEWIHGFQYEARGVDDRAEAEVTVNRWLSSPMRTLVMWYDEGRPVALAGSTGPTPHGIRIGAVYTPPQYRNRGYASACVADLSQKMLDAGYRYCFLFTDLSNRTSNSIYQNIGYEPVCDVDRYSFDG